MTLDDVRQLALSEEEIERLEAVYVPHPVSGIEL